MERKTAEFVVGVVNRCIDDLIASLAVVEKAVPAEEFAKYKRGVARVIGAFDGEIINRIAEEHPDLKPNDED
jgi:hypothetical protein